MRVPSYFCLESLASSDDTGMHAVKGRLAAILAMRTFSAALPLGFAVESTYSQISSEGVERHFIVSARAASLADAIVADPSDANSMYWNPSLLSFLRERSLITNYSLERIRSRDAIMNEGLVVPIILEPGWVLGLGALYSHVGHIQEGGPLSGYDYRQGSSDIALSLAVARALSVGCIATIRLGRAGSKAITAMSSAFGMTYQPSPEMSYGLSFQGFGNSIEYLLDTATSGTNPGLARLPQSLQLGVTLQFDALKDRPTIAISVADQKVFGVKGHIYKGGLEVWPVRFLALRLGYWVGSQTVAARYGSGIRLGQWQVDYGVSTTELEPMYHQISLSYCFSSHLDRR